MRNTSTRAGKEVVQLYTQDPVGSVVRPVQQLVDFRKISLEPGEIPFMVGHADHFLLSDSIQRI